MNDLLKSACDALIANDVSTLERLAGEAPIRTRLLLQADPAGLQAQLGPAAAVLGQQVRAASVHLALRRRLNAVSSLLAHPWAH